VILAWGLILVQYYQDTVEQEVYEVEDPDGEIDLVEETEETFDEEEVDPEGDVYEVEETYVEEEEFEE
jgi:hypothetical protein